MANLFPEGYENEVIESAEVGSDKPIGYRNGLSFDDKNGDFRRDGKNRIMDSNGIESWKSWVINCLLTERYAHLAYSTDFGIETGPIFRAESREMAESLLTREITEAIMADPYERTAYIEDISFDWTAPDSVLVSLTIQGIDEVSIDLEAYITSGEN